MTALTCMENDIFLEKKNAKFKLNRCSFQKIVIHLIELQISWDKYEHGEPYAMYNLLVYINIGATSR